MTKPDDPINPLKKEILMSSQIPDHITYAGLTKREYFAALAMQGICAGDIEVNTKITGYPEYTAELSVQFADALIAELNKTKDGK